MKRIHVEESAASIELLKQYDASYHNGVEIITDAEYDLLKSKIREAFPDHPYFKTVGAPTSDKSPWEKKKHRIVMGSIDNIQVDRERWVDSVLENGKKWWASLGRPALLVQVKLDGLSLNNEYEGELKRSILRGDGKEGEDILRNASKFHGVWMKASEEVRNIRGEALLFKKDLEWVNNELVRMGESPYSGCRAGASGIARRFDGKFADRLTFLAFDVQKKGEKQDSGALAWYAGKIPPEFIVPSVLCLTWEEVEKEYREIYKVRESFPFIMDGVVIKVNDMALRTDKSDLPEWARALKFPPEEQAFRVDKITWYVGKTGKLTPVMTNLDGVKFKDKVVKEVTLHSLNYFNEYKLAEGDEIVVTISMDVVPKIEKIKTRHGGKPFVMPAGCPACGQAVQEQGAYLFCTNQGCPAIIKAKILEVLKVFDIDAIGPEFVEKLWAHHEGRADAASVFAVSPTTLMHMGFQAGMINKIVHNINARREVDLETFFDALSIPMIGKRIMEKLEFVGIDAALSAKLEDIESKVGPAAARAFIKGVKDNYQLIGRLLANGVKIKSKTQVKVESNILEGKSFCFTGEVPETNPDTNVSYTREEMQEFVKRYGGVNKSSVSGKLDVLVMADPNSGTTKARKAKDMGTQLMSTREFLKILKRL